MGQAGTLLIVLTIISAPVIVVTAFFMGVLGNLLLFTVVFAILAYLGQVLFLVAMNELSYCYRDRAIFRNALYGFVVGAVGSAVYTIFIYGWFSSLRGLLPAAPANPSGPQATSFLLVFIGFFLIIWIGAFVLALLQGLFYRRAFYALADVSGSDNFRQAGLFMFIGGVLTIILVGSLIFFIGWIFAILGFFSLRPRPSQQIPLQAGKVRYCPNCGKENAESDVFCPRCGTKL
jgi:uncharacterized membrane protein